MANDAAMNTLRQAMQSTMPGQAFIEVIVARESEDNTSGLQHTKSLEALNTVGRERPIEVQAEDAPPEPPRADTAADEKDGKTEVEIRKGEWLVGNTLVVSNAFV